LALILMPRSSESEARGRDDFCSLSSARAGVAARWRRQARSMPWQSGWDRSRR